MLFIGEIEAIRSVDETDYVSFYSSKGPDFETESKVIMEEDGSQLQIKKSNLATGMRIEQNSVNGVIVMHKPGEAPNFDPDPNEPFRFNYIELRSNYNSTEIISGEVEDGLDVRDQNSVKLTESLISSATRRSHFTCQFSTNFFGRALTPEGISAGMLMCRNSISLPSLLTQIEETPG